MGEYAMKRGSAHDIDALGKLSDEIFRQEEVPGTAMPIEFGPMFSVDNAHNLYFVECEGRPVSLVGMVPGIVHVQGVAVSVASMGSVCTLANHRQNHFASQMVEQVICDFTPTTSVLLVSGALSIYRRQGCVDFGDWLGVTIQAGEHRVDDGITVAEFSGEVAAIHRLYGREGLRYARTKGETIALLDTLRAPRFRAQSRAPRLFVASEAGETIAYTIAIQPDRAGGGIHLLEWAGSRVAIPLLVDAACEAFGVDRAHLMISRQDDTMRSMVIRRQAEMKQETNQGTLRVLNPDRLLAEMGVLIRTLYGSALELPLVDQETWRVRWQSPAQSSHLLSHDKLIHGWAELSAWLFGCEGLNLPFTRTDDLNYV